MIRIRSSTPADGAAVVGIWCCAGDATHDFLSPTDRVAIKEEARAFLPDAPLTLAVDADDEPVAFMLVEGAHIEALFVDPAHHGTGIGSALIACALQKGTPLTVDVNEQNRRALGFYRRQGFVEKGRSPLDGQGRAYPLAHLRRDG